MAQRIDLEKALELRAQGQTFKQIGQRFGVSTQAAQQLLVAHGASRTYGSPIREARNRAIRVLQPQLRQARLAEIFGLSHQHVSRIVRGSG